LNEGLKLLGTYIGKLLRLPGEKLAMHYQLICHAVGIK
jgi:hypothetical protein